MKQSESVALLDILNWLRPVSDPGKFSRIGGLKDGAYVVPDDFTGLSACFSPGVANRKDFEDELLNSYGIRSHLMDASSDIDKFRTALVKGKQTFAKKWLMPEDSENSVSLETWVNSLEPGDSDLILQMDIEGAEYANLGSATREVLKRFRIIVLEVHGLAEMKNEELFLSSKGDLFRNLMRDFYVVHLHPNNCCGAVKIASLGIEIPKVLEITLLRKDRLSTWKATGKFPKTSPSALDIRWNVEKNPPLFLDDFFLAPEVLEASSNFRAALLLEWEVQQLKLRAGSLEKRIEDLEAANSKPRWWSRGKSD